MPLSGSVAAKVAVTSACTLLFDDDVKQAPRLTTDFGLCFALLALLCLLWCCPKPAPVREQYQASTSHACACAMHTVRLMPVLLLKLLKHADTLCDSFCDISRAAASKRCGELLLAIARVVLKIWGASVRAIASYQDARALQHAPSRMAARVRAPSTPDGPRCSTVAAERIAAHVDANPRAGPERSPQRWRPSR